MSGFWSATPGRLVFTEFGVLHWVVLAAVGLVIAGTVVFRKRLRGERVRRVVPLTVMIVAVVLEVAYHVWTGVHHLDFLFNLVPLELCAISLWLSVALIVTHRRGVFEILYFTSIGGLAAILFPAFGAYGPDHLRFWHYFVVHSYVLWIVAWFLAVEGYRLRRTALVRLLVVGLPFALVVWLIDRGFAVNYMYLAGPSATASPLDFLGQPPWYFVKLLGLAVVIFGLMYVVAPKEHRTPTVVPDPA